MKAYQDLLADVLENGVQKGDRTGTGTLSVFGRQFRHNLEDGFPLLTTKKLHFKSIINEMIWFLNGDTNTNWLKEHGVSIWNEWATEDGDLGPIYGKQWTAWPTQDGKSINQIDYVIHTLKTNPNSRRILFHGWNVEYLPDEKLSPQENAKNGKMALPPCHLLYQFYVANNKLSAHLYIRSSDLLLGNPYNLAGASFLTHMLAQQCDLGVGEVVVTMGDAHIYLNHIEQVKLQLTRAPRPLPRLMLNRKPDTIYGYKFEDFEIVGYDPHPHIPAPVSV
ncbi:thymidylate synthase [Stutzerimonas stutzeri]|uniref:thymidylate synthase n=1 Tax=Stutzerimonas stutzeri TaxID=316 RepID=UPI0015E3840E|nr:thymidylate synthase [Stutzerimonas stutzeri]MBA1278838.1 thymidylate synthase [Stutzerimonas stutzeri]